MPFPVGGPYDVGGLWFKKTTGAWPYVVTKLHAHTWAKAPRLAKEWPDKTSKVIRTRSGQDVAQLTGTSVNLLPDYAWDGSSGPAIDTRACMRASALHDVWCQAMSMDLYRNGYLNWLRGASEYRAICCSDGMPSWRAWLRYVAMSAYGLKKLWPG